MTTLDDIRTAQRVLRELTTRKVALATALREAGRHEAATTERHDLLALGWAIGVLQDAERDAIASGGALV